MADDKQKLLAGNTQEYLAGVEWDINKYITVSAGGQRTHYALGNGSYLTDMSFVTSSYSCGFGAKFKIAKTQVSTLPISGPTTSTSIKVIRKI